jgi:chromosome segregation ATPase
MTSENQALLDAIQGIVERAIAPLTERMDILTERVDTLTERVDTLTARVDALTERVDTLTERVDALTERVDRLDARVDALTERVDRLDTRMERLENRVEAIDTRTGQMAAVLLDLRDRVPLLEERVDNGFRALKSDLNFAFSDARKVSMAQNNYEKTIDALRKEVASIQQRLTALERSQGAS